MSNKKRSNHTTLHYFIVILWYLFKSIVGVSIWVVVGFFGVFLFLSRIAPLDKLIGLPILFVAIGFVLQAIYSNVLSVFSPTFNKGVCPFCNTS